MRYLEALHALVDLTGVNSDKASELKNVFTLEHGTDEEKEAVKAGDPAAQAEAKAKAEFDAAVAAEIARRQQAAAVQQAADQQAAAVQKAADQAQAPGA